MNLYNNLKISGKLLTGFIIVALLAGAVGLIGVLNIRSIDTKYSNLFEQYGVALGDIGRVSTDFQIERGLIKQIIIDKGLTSSKSSDLPMMQQNRTWRQNTFTAEA